MTFNKFYVILFLIILLLCGFGAVTIWSFQSQHLVISRYIIAGLWGLSIYLFFNHIRKSTIIIKEFISNIKEGDFVFLPGTKNAFGREFNDVISFLNNKIKNIKIEKEEQYHLFTNAVNQTGSGIIVFDADGHIELINKATKDIFGYSTLRNVNTLVKYNPELPKKLNSDTDDSFIISIQVNGELVKIAVYKNQFFLGGKKLKVASIQNISNELDKEELDAYKKLMHVITHEIMNSVTPMKTLAYSLLDMYTEKNQPKLLEQMNQQKIDDSYAGLNALNNRVQGLMSFVDSYRKLYKIPKPNYSNFSFTEIISEISVLFKTDLNLKNIELKIKGNTNLMLFADKFLLTQVMINLVKNAVDAVENASSPSIEIKFETIKDENIISVRDNGKGMSISELNEIFVPFYTTKKEGSGIGLYYSKLIVLMHKGKLKVKSEPGKGSSFYIHL